MSNFYWGQMLVVHVIKNNSLLYSFGYLNFANFFKVKFLCIAYC